MLESDELSSGGANNTCAVVHCTQSWWSTQKIIAFMQRCLIQKEREKWITQASLFRGPPRNICDSVELLAANRVSNDPFEAFTTRVTKKQCDIIGLFKSEESAQNNKLSATPTRGAAHTKTDNAGVVALLEGLFNMQLPVSDVCNNVDQWTKFTKSGIVFTLSVEPSPGSRARVRMVKFVFATDPATVAATTMWLATELRSCVDNVLDLETALSRHPSTGTISGFIVELAVAMCFARSFIFSPSLNGKKGLFAEWLQRLSSLPLQKYDFPTLETPKPSGQRSKSSSAKIPTVEMSWTEFLNFSPEPVFVISPEFKPHSYTDIPEVPTLASFLEQAAASASFPYFFLPDTNAGPDGCVMLSLLNGQYVLILVGIKWYGTVIPSEEKVKNERSVDPKFLYCDLTLDEPKPKVGCPQFKSRCHEALNDMIKRRKLAAVMSFIVNLENPKGTVRGKDVFVTDTCSLVAGRAVPWLKVRISKDQINCRQQTQMSKTQAYKNSFLYEFGAHPAFYTTPVNINKANAKEMMERVVGVGAKTAQTIIDERQCGQFKSLDNAQERLPSLQRSLLARFDYGGAGSPSGATKHKDNVLDWEDDGGAADEGAGDAGSALASAIPAATTTTTTSTAAAAAGAAAAGGGGAAAADDDDDAAGDVDGGNIRARLRNRRPRKVKLVLD